MRSKSMRRWGVGAGGGAAGAPSGDLADDLSDDMLLEPCSAGGKSSAGSARSDRVVSALASPAGRGPLSAPGQTAASPASPFGAAGSPFGAARRGRGATSLTPKSFRSLFPGKGRRKKNPPFGAVVREEEAEEEAVDEVRHISAGGKPALSSRTQAIHARTMAAANAEGGRPPALPGLGLSPKGVRDLPDADEVRVEKMQPSLPDREDTAAESPSRRKGMKLPEGDGGESVFGGASVALSEHWMIDPASITPGKTIGNSSFGSVHEGRFNGTKVAVKIIKRESGTAGAQDMDSFKKEAELNCKLRHPNIVLFMGICIEPSQVCIVTELMARGNVHDLLLPNTQGKSVKLSWDTRLQWALDTAQGMAYLHSLDPPMIHRDLKTTNLLVDRGMNVKICDFGLSRFQAKDKVMSAVGTVQFAAPEVLRHEKYTEKADLFSFGTVLWELHTRKTIFQGRPHFETYQAVVDGDMPGLGAGCDKEYAKLVADCWLLDQSKRPSFREVLDRLGPMLPEPEYE